jgi:hypothetical protein
MICRPRLEQEFLFFLGNSDRNMENNNFPSALSKPCKGRVPPGGRKIYLGEGPGRKAYILHSLTEIGIVEICSLPVLNRKQKTSQSICS